MSLGLYNTVNNVLHNEPFKANKKCLRHTHIVKYVIYAKKIHSLTIILVVILYLK